MGLKREGETRSVTGGDLQPGDRLIPNQYTDTELHKLGKEGKLSVLRLEEVPSDPNMLNVYLEEEGGLVRDLLVERDAEYQVVE